MECEGSYLNKDKGYHGECALTPEKKNEIANLNAHSKERLECYVISPIITFY